jgi:hypothetical protein
MAYTKERICSDCGKVETIRKDSTALRCRSCASSIAGKKGVLTIKSRTKHTPCKHCGIKIRAKLNYNFCSVDCRKKDSHTNRTCKQCGESFQVRKKSITSNTNASGNYCSRPCYEKWMCKTDRTTGRGSQWKKSRDEAIKKTPFCFICGTNKKLEVHHIVPFRLTNDNSQINLSVLCKKHHKVVETLTHDIEHSEDDFDRMLFVIRNMLIERRTATLLKLKEIINANV